MHRREFLMASTVLTGAVSAGCTGLFETRPAGEPPVVEDRPDAVYIPTHIEGMEMSGMVEAGDYTIGLSYSYPHRFWLVSGRETERVSVQDDDSIHLMMSAWETDTGVVMPTASHSIELTQDGELVDERSLWPMLSQSMGYHFGDNVALAGDGTYTATVRIDPLDARRTGGFADKFDETVTAEIEFPYSQETRDDIMVETFEDEQGEEGAVEPMDMEMMPLAEAPSADALPGNVIGEATSGDARFVSTVVRDADRFAVEEGSYLAVSPRTPYNRFPLPFMTLSATLTRDGNTAFEGALQAAVDPDLKYHYGTEIEGVESGDTLTITVESPPQVARHEGYETAFLEMPDMDFTV